MRVYSPAGENPLGTSSTLGFGGKMNNSLFGGKLVKFRFFKGHEEFQFLTGKRRIPYLCWKNWEIPFL